MTTKQTYIRGFKGFYTGETQIIHGGLFHNVEMVEGPDIGKIKVTMTTPEGFNPSHEQSKKDWKDLQDGFSRLKSL